jgi:ribose-phosphate pyrophosphokinase
MSTHHPLRVFSGSANRPLAEDVVRLVEQIRQEEVADRTARGEGTTDIRQPIELGDCKTTHLPDSEIHVAINQVVRDQDVFIIQPCSRPVNDNLMELLLYIDAFRRASAHEITAVIPYYPYGRQERMAKGREAISARVVATVLEALGVSRVVYFDVHAPATQGFFQVPVDPLTALPVLAAYFKRPEFRNAAIVSPDVGRAKFAGKYAEYLKLPLVVMHKRRESYAEADVTHVVGDIEDKTPIIIDDVIAGGSVLKEVDALVKKGARPEVYLAITHGVLLPSALKLLDADSRIRRLVISDTICQPDTIRSHSRITVRSVAQLLAQVIWRIHCGESISNLIEKT